MKRALLLLSLVLPIVFACLYSITVSRLYVYYDMGVNATANLGEIVFIILPMMLIILFATLGTTKIITNKLHFSHWKTFFTETAIQLFVFSIVFFNKFESLRNYPVSNPYNIIYFFSHFFDI
jgi:hypothetical protein